MRPVDRLPAELRERLRAVPSERAAELVDQSPMLAVSSGRVERDEDWVFERKLDGIRALALRTGPQLRLLSRSGKSLNASYPELVDALLAQPAQQFAVDGEITAMRDGRTDFALLQQRMQLTDPRAIARTGVQVSHHLFDLLWADGYDTTQLPLPARKALLSETIDFTPPLYFTEHHRGHAKELLAAACARGWEGLIAKRVEGRYVHRRSTGWVKLKCVTGQEFVVGGYTDPTGSRVGFGALLVGYQQDGRLRYAGKVGTGFDTRTLLALRRFFDATAQPDCPFDPAPSERHAHWVRPLLVVQVAFTEWTRAGQLRHPRFLGVRDDKPPSDVVREVPEP